MGYGCSIRFLLHLENGYQSVAVYELAAMLIQRIRTIGNVAGVILLAVNSGESPGKLWIHFRTTETRATASISFLVHYGLLNSAVIHYSLYGSDCPKVIAAGYNENGLLLRPVSYTHLTLPTIYSV